MPNVSALTRRARGLYLQYNSLSEVPEGALLEADDVVIEREGEISKRRGMNRYGVTFDADRLFEYQNKLLGLAGSTLKYDANGDGSLWTAYAGAFADPNSTTRMRSTQGLKNLYFTSSAGIMKTDAVTKIPIRAGISTGLDIGLNRVGTGSSWFLPDTQVAYRILWGRIDDNDFLVTGAPSFREVITNASTAVTFTATGTTVTVAQAAHGYAVNDLVEISEVTDTQFENGSHTVTSITTNTWTYTVSAAPPVSGKSGRAAKKFNVRLVFSIPKEMLEGDFYEIYRTDLSPDASTGPDDRCFRVIRGTLSATDITNRDASGTPITITDNLATDSLGEDLYTNDTQETILQQNARPPFALDMTLFRGYMFYSNTIREHFADIQLIEIAGLVDGTSSISLVTGTTTYTYKFDTTEDPAARKFKRYTGSALLVTNIKDTTKSLVTAINRDPNNTLYYAYYLSGFNDPPGIVGIQKRAVNQASFTITCNNSTTSGVFTPAIPTSGTLYESMDDAAENRLFHSKIEQYESVPETNYDDIGDASKAIVRILPLRDSLIILKEDGVWRLSGDSERNFTIRQLDPTQRIRAPEAAVVFDNAVYCMTTSGLVRITESGTTLVSRPIDDELIKIQGYANYQTLTHAIAYESESKYILFAQGSSTDVKANIAWVYNSITKTWTRWKKAVKAAWIMFDQDVLYLSHGTDAFLLKERKSLGSDGSDFQDETLNCTFDSVGTSTDEDGNIVSTVTLSFGYSEPKPGWLFENNPISIPRTSIIAVQTIGPSLYILTLKSYIPGLAPGSATLTLGIPSRVKWVPEEGDSAGTIKQYSTIQIYLKDGNSIRHRVGTSSDLVPTETMLDVKLTTSTGGSIIRIPVPRNFQRARALNLSYEHRTGKEEFVIQQVTYMVRVFGDRTSMVPK